MYEPILTDFSGLGPFRWAFLIVFIFGGLIPTSRMYLGVHSADQILTGLALSFCFLVLYRFTFQKLLFQYLKNCAFSKKNRIPLVLITVILHLLLLAIPLILYVINTTTNIVDQSILDQANRACKIT